MSFDRVQKLLAEAEDLFGVPKRHSALIRKNEVPSFSHEQLLAEDLFQPMDLATDGRMRKTQLPSRCDDAPLLGDDPEIQKVVVVEPFHAESPRPVTQSKRGSRSKQ